MLTGSIGAAPLRQEIQRDRLDRNAGFVALIRCANTISVSTVQGTKSDRRGEFQLHPLVQGLQHSEQVPVSRASQDRWPSQPLIAGVADNLWGVGADVTVSVTNDRLGLRIGLVAAPSLHGEVMWATLDILRHPGTTMDDSAPLGTRSPPKPHSPRTLSPGHSGQLLARASTLKAP
jgi:hypothetical protein